MKLLKCTILIFLALSLVFANGCGRNLKPLTNTDKMCEEVLIYLDTNDAEGLKSMFCDKTIAEIPDLDEQIEAAMEFYEGKTVSHGNILVSEGEAVDNGVTTKHRVNPHIVEIKTDSGNEYDIKIYSYYVYTKDTTMEGVSEIDIYNENQVVCVIGDNFS